MELDAEVEDLEGAPPLTFCGRVEIGVLGDEVIDREDGPDAYLGEDVEGAIPNCHGIDDLSGLDAGADETGLGGVRAAKEEVDAPADEVVLAGDPDAVAVPKHGVGIAHITQ